MNKLIVTLAVLGNVPTKELNPATPITPEEIVGDIVECEQVGASIAHIHVRDDEGQPTSDRNKFNQVLRLLDEKKSNVIRQLSTGARGGGANDKEFRSQMIDLEGVEMASLSTGSSNFINSVNSNSFELIEHLANKMVENNVKPEIEVFDAAMIDNAVRLAKKGVIKTPMHFNLVMGVPGSIAGTPRNMHFLAESLPKDCTWSVCGIGPAQVPMIAMAMILGGHVRTGLEDTLLYDKGIPANNKMLVERVVRLAKELRREIATPDEAREILSL